MRCRRKRNAKRSRVAARATLFCFRSSSEFGARRRTLGQATHKRVSVHVRAARHARIMFRRLRNDRNLEKKKKKKKKRFLASIIAKLMSASFSGGNIIREMWHGTIIFEKHSAGRDNSSSTHDDDNPLRQGQLCCSCSSLLVYIQTRRVVEVGYNMLGVNRWRPVCSTGRQITSERSSICLDKQSTFMFFMFKKHSYFQKHIFSGV